MNALANGERQVAADLSGIRRDHVARYQFAIEQLDRPGLVLDLACGVGYGAAMLADAGHSVIAVDRSQEAIAFGRQNYAREKLKFLVKDAGALDVDGSWLYSDAAVCFETIEHLADPLPMLRALRQAAPRLIASVPNEAVFPYRCDENNQRGWAHHHRHYTRQQFAELLAAAGWRPLAWFGQVGTQSPVEAEVEGRTLIVVAERGAETTAAPQPAEPAAAPAPAETVPDHVAIVGLGPTCAAFFEFTRRLGGASAYCDEVWGINAIGDVLQCDRIFHMDDVLVQEIRAAAKPTSNIAAMVAWLKRHPGPIYTSVARPGYPGLVAFPLEAVLNGGYDTNGGAPYFNSTAAYAIAFAVHLGVKKISLFGLDYTLPNSHQAEQGRACCEFWLGIAAARGIQIVVPEGSSLLDACAPDKERLYGYDCVDVHLADQPDGSVKVSFTDAAPPTAEAVEQRYDHSRHPNRLMEQDDAARKSH